MTKKNFFEFETISVHISPPSQTFRHPYFILFIFSGGQQHEKFIEEALGRSSPGSARLLAELFGGFELGLEYRYSPTNAVFTNAVSTNTIFLFSSDSQAIITVGGAATKCQHQSPCYDNNCKACYDPLLRIHGKCGGASYFTCRGSLPRDCMPYTCTYRVSYENSKFRFGNS